jgi:hypothetical protein
MSGVGAGGAAWMAGSSPAMTICEDVHGGRSPAFAGMMNF